MGSTGTKGVRSGGATATGTGPIVGSGPVLAPNTSIPPANQGNPQVAQQAPTAQNTPVTAESLDKISKMSDDELAALVQASKKALMPNFLADGDDETQKFVFQAGMNEKPMVLDKAEFDKFKQDNNIDDSEVIARSVGGASYRNQQNYQVNYTPQQVQDILKYSRLTYIGGKHGGKAYGSGAYFAMTGGDNTGYGGNTALAVLNPNTAHIIDRQSLNARISRFAQSHPKFAQAMGYRAGSSVSNSKLSVWALAMGYNVITNHTAVNGKYVRHGRKIGTNTDGTPKYNSTGDYYNIIDRSALVYLK